MSNSLSERYNALECEVMDRLKELVSQSNTKSNHIDGNVLFVNVYDYEELAIINGDLTFLDDDGLRYSIYAECDLEDLIDIINKVEVTSVCIDDEIELRIAGFIGMQHTSIGWYDAEENLKLSNTRDNTFDELLFSKSWEWLMSVVDYIENINNGQFQVDILQEGCKINNRCNSLINKTVSNLPTETNKINAVILAIDEFISWYRR